MRVFGDDFTIDLCDKVIHTKLGTAWYVHDLLHHWTLWGHTWGKGDKRREEEEKEEAAKLNLNPDIHVFIILFQ